MTAKIPPKSSSSQEPRYFVLWKANVVTFQGNTHFSQQIPLLKTFGDRPDGILAYSSLKRFDHVFQNLQKGEVSKHFKEFLDGYNPRNYLRSFTIDSISEYFDCFTILVDLPTHGILKLLEQDQQSRIDWLYSLDIKRTNRIEIIKFPWDSWKKSLH